MQVAPTGTVCPDWDLKPLPRGPSTLLIPLFPYAICPQLLPTACASSPGRPGRGVGAFPQPLPIEHLLSGHRDVSLCAAISTGFTRHPFTEAQPPNSHRPRLFQSTKINSFIRTFDSIFPTEKEDAWRLLLKAALFGAQVAIYLLDDEKEKETSMYNSPLE